MKFMSLLVVLFPISSWGSAYFDLSGGALHNELRGDSQSYRASQSFASEVSIGNRWEKWDLSLDGLYSIARQKELSFSYGTAQVKDDFNWHSISVGPTVKYHIQSQSGNWSWAPFAGVFYNHTSFDNSSEFKDATTGKDEDNSHEAWGYGAKLGVQFKTYTNDSSWLESVNYKLFGSYTKYRKSEADYLNSTNNINEYKGDTPDNLNNYSVGVMVGLTFGDKLYKKTKSALGLK